MAITDWLGVRAPATALYGLVEPWFNAITTLNLVVLMAAGMAAMVRVVQVMYLRRRSV